MKILEFVENFMGPTILFIYDEITELSKKQDVLLLTTKQIDEFKDDYPFENIKVIPFTPNRVTTKINWILEKKNIVLNRRNSKFANSLNSLVKSYQPDVIHGHFGYESIILLDNLNKYDGPIFVSFYGYDSSELLKVKSYVNKLNSLSKKFNLIPLYVSNLMRDDLIAAGVNMDKGQLHRSGINTDHFAPQYIKAPKDKYIFLQISRFTESKGYYYTVHAFKKFLDSVADKNKYKLILAGTGILLEEIKNEVKKLGIQNAVEFTGMVTFKGLLPLLQMADSFIHPSLTAANGKKEGIPTVIMEAMAMGIPVISTTHAGIPELVEDGVNGYLVSERNIDELTQRMHDILTWPQLPQSREKILNSFSNQAHLARLLELYSQNVKTRM